MEQYIQRIKAAIIEKGIGFHPSVTWCDTHEKLPDKLGGYDAWPLLKNKETGEVVSYMNEHGYEMNTNGTPSHPFADAVGLSKLR